MMSIEAERIVLGIGIVALTTLALFLMPGRWRNAIAGYLTWDNFQNCLRRTFSFAAFSEHKRVNRILIRVSTFWFIGTRFKPLALKVQIGSALIALFSAGAKLLTADVSQGIVLEWVLYISLAATAISTVRNFLRFHKVDAAGPAPEAVYDLNDVHFALATPPSKDHLYLANLRKRSEMQPLFTEERAIAGTPALICVEFDRAVSAALLRTQSMRFTNASNRDVENESAIVARLLPFSRDPLAAFQIKRHKNLDAGASFFNADKVSVRSLSTGIGPREPALMAAIGRTSYFLSAMTNDVATSVLTRVNNGTLVRSNLQKLFPAQLTGGIWFPTDFKEGAPLSNHIGCVVLAISGDGYPIFCRQSKEAVQAGGKFVLSGAGSLEWKDIKHSHPQGKNRWHTDMQSFVRYGMARELLEETKAILQDSHRRADQAIIRSIAKSIQVAGFYRDFNRGGFPIFLGFVRLKETWLEVKERKAPKFCLFGGTVETEVVDNEDCPRVTDYETMSDALKWYIGKSSGLEQHYRDPSDQVLIIRKLIAEVPEVQKHLNLALDPMSRPAI